MGGKPAKRETRSAESLTLRSLLRSGFSFSAHQRYDHPVKSLASQFCRTALIICAAVLTILLQAGCSKPAEAPSAPARSTQTQVSTATTEPEITDRIRKEVAGILKKKESDIDIAKPLSSYGADDLDIVEIIMATEEAFAVEIPDEALGEKFRDAAKTLTIQKLAAIVAEKKKSK